MNNILIIGSNNTDMMVKTNRFPREGETVFGGKFLMNQGGKGSNQAVAAARLGAKVTFVTKVGNDIFGKQTVENLKKEGVDTSQILVDESASSGIALITVNEKGENNIVVASGANMNLQIADILQIDKYILLADVILLQLEIPMETVEYVAEKAKKYGKKIILNPAPATKLSDKLLDGLYLITPNQSEAELLIGTEITDEDPLRRSADLLRLKGVKNVIFTLGEKGIFLSNLTTSKYFDPPRVKVIDTTAAGDIFNGALATALSNGKDWNESIEFATNAASISVTRIGAQASAPTLAEVEDFSEKLKNMNENTEEILANSMGE
ncbi:MAG: ribokinase [Bacteroidota bacterium]